ncbi:MAG: hypothetical protein JWP88_1313 [Flaviaesturariibacter sp.]|nr:hypothetical protein [Flaviaesturariibacter sp.]
MHVFTKQLLFHRQKDVNLSKSSNFTYPIGQKKSLAGARLHNSIF